MVAVLVYRGLSAISYEESDCEVEPCWESKHVTEDIPIRWGTRKHAARTGGGGAGPVESAFVDLVHL